MLKKLVILASLILFSVTAFGQVLKPHRIVYEGDTGVFFNKQQELLLLTIIKTEKSQKKEIEQLYIYKNNCDDQLLKEQKHSEDLNRAFTSMETEAKTQRDKYQEEVVKHTETKLKLEKQEGKVKTFRNIAIAEGIGLIGILFLVLR
jgi:hypothetical protein